MITLPPVIQIAKHLAMPPFHANAHASAFRLHYRNRDVNEPPVGQIKLPEGLIFSETAGNA